MTVKELIKKLEEIEDGDRVVVIAIDQEGNSFSKMSGDMWQCRFDLDSRETGLERLSDELREEGYTEGDVMVDGVPALVLWP